MVHLAVKSRSYTLGVLMGGLEANDHSFWEADDATLEALQEIYGDLVDRLEG